MIQRKVSAGALGAGGGTSSSTKKFNNRCLVHPNCEHLTRKCRKFLSMDVVERGNLVKDTCGCKLCLSLSHVGEPDCPLESKFGKCTFVGCAESHSHLVHGCKIPGITCHACILPTNVNLHPSDSNSITQQ